MPKFLDFLGMMLNLDKLKRFDGVDMLFRDKQASMMACLLARFAYMMNQDIDEDESAEIIEDFFKINSLDIHNIHDLAAMVKSTAFDPRRDQVH